MKRIKNLFTTSVVTALVVGSFALQSCGGVSEEQFAELHALQNEVSAF